jgi:hypothetical protein
MIIFNYWNLVIESSDIECNSWNVMVLLSCVYVFKDGKLLGNHKDGNKCARNATIWNSCVAQSQGCLEIKNI